MTNHKTYTNKANSIQIYIFKRTFRYQRAKKKKLRTPKRENIRLA